MLLSDRQKFALALRRLQRGFAVMIYPQFGRTEVSELDAEFQRGLEAGMEAQEWAQECRDGMDGKRLVTRVVMGQNDDGSPNGEDYTEDRYVTDWRRA